MSSSILAALRGNPVFAHAPEQDLVRLTDAARELTIPSGEVVLREGDPSEDLYVLLEGTIGIAYTSSEGLSITVKVLGAPCSVGEMELLADLPRQETVVALEKCELVLIPKSPCLHYLENDPQAAMAKLREMSAWLAISTHLERGLAFNPVPVRLAGFLVYLCQRFSDQSDDGTRIRLRLSYVQLAAALAVTPRSIERTVGGWLKEGWLMRSKGRYVIKDMKKLLNCADPDWLDLLERLANP